MWGKTEVESNLVKECGACGTDYEIQLDQVYPVIRKLCDVVETEWQMLLTGEWKDNTLVIDGYYIPTQTVTGSTVDNTECITEEMIAEKRIVATIHSHAGMGVFFSGRDNEFTNNSPLIKTHIVTNNKGEFEAETRVLLPCGKEYMVEADVFVLPYSDVDIVGMDKIEHKTYEYPLGTPLTGYQKHADILTQSEFDMMSGGMNAID